MIFLVGIWHNYSVFKRQIQDTFLFLPVFRTLIPLFDDDTGLLILAGMVRYTNVHFLWSDSFEERWIFNVNVKMMLLCSLAQGDTVVDCFEVSTSQPLLSQGNAHLLYLSLVQLLFPVSDLSFSFRFQWATVWRTPQHEALPWYPRCRWMSCLAKWCVCCSWQTAASCLSAIKSLARCDRRPITDVCDVLYKLALVFSCVHVCRFVLQHSSQEFHEDIYPDTVGSTPAMSAEEWWQGGNKQVKYLCFVFNESSHHEDASSE